VVDRADRGVGIRREVDSSQVSRKGHERPNETGVLVRVPVVLLSPQSARLDVGETGDIASPFGLEGHLDELGVLL